MKKLSFVLLLALSAILLLAAGESRIPSMPAAVSSNAVASLKGGLQLFSLMGVGPRKTWDDITNQVYVMNLSSGKWRAEISVTASAHASAARSRSENSGASCQALSR